MTIIELLDESEKRLAENDVDSPRLDAEVLISHALNCARADLYTQRGRGLAPKHLKLIKQYIQRRASGEPVAYITGIKEFWSIPIRVTPDVLIPRPETELVVERALEIVGKRDRPVDILDLCTGSGCIAAALATELPQARITVTDVSKKAIQMAKQNLSFAKDRVEFLIGDLFEALTKRPSKRTSDERPATKATAGTRATSARLFDLITANPPYVPTSHKRLLPREIADREPEIALYAGKSGLDFMARIIEDGSRFLKPGGWLVMEMGLGQTAKLQRSAEQFGGYGQVVVSEDLARIERVISLQKHSSN